MASYLHALGHQRVDFSVLVIDAAEQDGKGGEGHGHAHHEDVGPPAVLGRGEVVQADVVKVGSQQDPRHGAHHA